jgi:tRNA(adenine34) deaminase
VQPTCNHRPEIVGGLEEREAAALLRDFFKERR